MDEVYPLGRAYSERSDSMKNVHTSRLPKAPACTPPIGPSVPLIHAFLGCSTPEPRPQYSARMYTVGVRDHISIAHTLTGQSFGPAPRLHGATYTVSVEVEREELSQEDIVLDIGILREELHHVLGTLNHQNLDDHPAFRERRSTAELIARYIHRELGRLLPISLGGTLAVTLDESQVAWTRYRAPVRGVTIGEFIPGQS